MVHECGPLCVGQSVGGPEKRRQIGRLRRASSLAGNPSSPARLRAPTNCLIRTGFSSQTMDRQVDTSRSPSRQRHRAHAFKLYSRFLTPLFRGNIVVSFGMISPRPKTKVASSRAVSALANAYVLMQHTTDAPGLFDRLLRMCNDIGLVKVEYDVRARPLVGNFSRAVSRIALVETDHNIACTAKLYRLHFGKYPVVEAAE